MNCALATWSRTDTGRLSPSGDGRCTWKAPERPVIPKAFYFFGFGSSEPSGGNINRKRPHTECPLWEKKHA
jgi:hypothetical protein